MAVTLRNSYAVICGIPAITKNNSLILINFLWWLGLCSDVPERITTPITCLTIIYVLRRKNPLNDQSNDQSNEYWRANVRLIIICLIIWAIASYGCGILLVDVLNNIQIGGFKLGFWFAQQGSIYVFLLLILFYAVRMNQIDRKYNVDEQ
jgi:putative solute:sodium symporter small subunit